MSFTTVGICAGFIYCFVPRSKLVPNRKVMASTMERMNASISLFMGGGAVFVNYPEM